MCSSNDIEFTPPNFLDRHGWSQWLPSDVIKTIYTDGVTKKQFRFKQQEHQRDGGL